MAPHGRTVLAGFLIVTLIASTLVIAIDAVPRGESQACSRDFQQLVHGLGLGAELEMSPCNAGFDWRLSATCAFDTGPIAGSGFRCDAQETVCPHERYDSGADVGEGNPGDAENP